MDLPFNNPAWTGQGFEVLDRDCKVTDAMVRIMFRGFMISFSSWGYSVGGAFNSVVIFESVPREKYPYSRPLKDVNGDRIAFRSPQQAIEHIVKNNLEPQYGFGKPRQKD